MPSFHDFQRLLFQCFAALAFEASELANNTSQQTSLVMPSFHDFQRLPPELRDQIWRLAMEPRQIRILFNGHYYLQSRSPTTPRALVAPLLHACSESRLLMKKLCKKVVVPFVISDGSYVWVNYDLDTIFSNCAQIQSLQIYIDPNMIQHLHLQCRVDQSTLSSIHTEHCMSMGLHHLWRLPNLTDVLLNLEAPDARPQLRSQP